MTEKLSVYQRPDGTLVVEAGDQSAPVTPANVDAIVEALEADFSNGTLALYEDPVRVFLGEQEEGSLAGTSRELDPTDAQDRVLFQRWVNSIRATVEGQSENAADQVTEPSPPRADSVRSDQGLGPVEAVPNLEDSGSEGESSVPDSNRQGTTSTAQGGSKTGGDPLLLSSGQFYHQITDIELAGRGLSLEFTRTYLSGAFYKGPLGYNWDHNYNLWLREEQERGFDGTIRNVVYRSTGTVREDAYVQRLHDATGDLNPLTEWVDAEFDGPPGFFDRLEKTSGRYVLETAEGLRYVYDDTLAVDYIVDRHGNRLSFQYDAEGRLRNVKDPVGKELKFSYDRHNRIEWVHDVVGEREIHYWYGDNGDLEEVDLHLGDGFVAGTDYRYSGPESVYELQHNLEEIINPLGEAVVSNEYGTSPGADNYNRVTRQRSVDGEFRYEYQRVLDPSVDPNVDPHNVPVMTTDVVYPNGHVVEHQFNSQAKVVRRREYSGEPRGSRTLLESTYRYNRDGLLVEETLADGSRTEYTYGREAYAETSGEPEGAPPLDRLTFGNLTRIMQYPRPGLGEPRRIRTDYTYWDRDQVGGERIRTVRGPFYTNEGGAELPGQSVGTTSYEYNSNGSLLMVRLPEVVRPDGSTLTPEPYHYEYDEHGLLTDAYVAGTHVRFEYYSDELRSGFVHRYIEDPNGVSRHTVYRMDDLGRVTKTVGPFGAEQETEWTPFDAIKETRGPALGGVNPVTKLHYNDNRDLIRTVTEVVGPDGSAHPDEAFVESFRYNRFGQQIGHDRGPLNNPSEHSRTTIYNPSGRYERTTDWNGTITRYEYNSKLFPKRVTRAWGTTDASLRSFRYDEGNRVIERTDSLGESIRYEYDAFGRRHLERNPDEREDRFEFDAAGRPIRHQLFGPSSTSQSTRWAESTVKYDSLGRVIQRNVHLFNPDSDPEDGSNDRVLSAALYYDGSGRLVRTRDPTGAETTFEYDGLGRQIYVEDADGNVRRFRYDDAAKSVNISSTYVGHDSGENPITHVDQERIFFDSRGLQVRTIDPAGNETYVKYDSRGNSVQTVDPSLVERAVDRDIFGRIATVYEGSDPDQRTTHYRYNSMGKLVELVDPEKNTTVIHRDALGRPKQVTRGKFSRTYQFNGEDQCTDLTDENGITIHREFSPGGKLVREHPDGTGFVAPPSQPNYKPEPTLPNSFVYSPTGQVTRAENKTAVAFRYDSLGRVVEEHLDTHVVSYAYDDGDRLEKLVYPDGRTIRYQYSDAGYLLSVSQESRGERYPGDAAVPSTHQLVQARRVGDKATHLDYGTVQASVEYNSRRLPIGVDWTQDGTNLLRERRLYGSRGECRVEQFDDRLRIATFDQHSRETTVTDRVDVPIVNVSSLVPPSDIAGLEAVGQSAEDSLFPADSGRVASIFKYDLSPNTNRTAVTETKEDGSTVVTDYQLGSLDRYLAIGGKDVSYDRAGNFLGDSSHQITYDTHHRVTKLKKDGRTTQLDYDALGRIVGIDEGIGTRQIVYAGNQPIEWRVVNGDQTWPVIQQVPSLSTICHLATGGRDHIPVTDMMGSVVAWHTDGAFSGMREYSPFGQTTKTSGSWHAPIGYRSYLEEQHGFSLLFARTYDPRHGRFLQPDPAGFVDGTNLYAYADHAPLISTDLWGFASRDRNWSTSADDSSKSSGPTVGQAPPEEERSFWSRGGATLLGGAGGIALGTLIVLSGPIGWAGGLAAAMLFASGTAGVGIGAAQLATTHTRTAKQDAQLNRAVDTTMALTSSPGGLAGGTIGVAVTGDEDGLYLGANVGGLVEGGGSLIRGGTTLVRRDRLFRQLYRRGYTYKYNDTVRKYTREVYGYGRTRRTPTRPNPEMPGGVEQLELSHFVAQRSYSEGSFLGRTLFNVPVQTRPGRTARLGDYLFNRPWNLKPMWRSEAALVDPSTRVSGIRPLPPIIRHIRAAPDELQMAGYGIVRSIEHAGNINSGEMSDTSPSDQ